MRPILMITALFLVFSTSCHKDTEGKGDCLTVGCWGDDDDLYYIFANEQIDFYCLNGPTAIGVATPENESWQGDLIRLWGYPYYLEKKGEGLNLQFDLFKGGPVDGVFNIFCEDNAKNSDPFVTYLFVENYNQITKDTKEIHCRLEYREKVFVPLDWPNTVLDSQRVTLKRVN